MYSENLLRIVSAGSFPGNYEEAAIKNQATKRKAPPLERSQKRGVPQSLYIDIKKRESGFDMYEKRKPRKKATVLSS
jgi:soluble lytic murein transglycosylase-like protein